MQQTAANGVQLSDTTWWQKWKQSQMQLRQAAVEAEEKLLSRTSVQYTITDTHIGPDAENFIHSISVGDASKPTLVCIPGYCAGAVMYFKNLNVLTVKYHTILVDWPGQGLSGRPPFTAKNNQQSVDFFVHALEKWSKLNGISKMTVLGHSMGGYIAAQYAFRNPEQVEQLILACSAGIANKPEHHKHKYPPFWSARGQLFRLAASGWQLGITPGVMLRSIGPFGYIMIQKYTDSRFYSTIGWCKEEADLMRDYLYNTLTQTGSAEFALQHILEPFAWAKDPLEEKLLQIQIPFSFVYAQNDFITPDVAHRINKELVHLQKPTVKIEVIQNAGHLVYMETPDEFAERVISITS